MYIDIAGPRGDFTFTKPNDLVISTSSPIGIVAGVAAQVVAKLGPRDRDAETGNGLTDVPRTLALD